MSSVCRGARTARNNDGTPALATSRRRPASLPLTAEAIDKLSLGVWPARPPLQYFITVWITPVPYNTHTLQLIAHLTLICFQQHTSNPTVTRLCASPPKSKHHYCACAKNKLGGAWEWVYVVLLLFLASRVFRASFADYKCYSPPFQMISEYSVFWLKTVVQTSYWHCRNSLYTKLLLTLASACTCSIGAHLKFAQECRFCIQYLILFWLATPTNNYVAM